MSEADDIETEWAAESSFVDDARFTRRKCRSWFPNKVASVIIGAEFRSHFGNVGQYPDEDSASALTAECDSVFGELEVLSGKSRLKHREGYAMNVLGTVVPDPAPEGVGEICHDFVYRWLVIRGDITGNYPNPMNTLGQNRAQTILYPIRPLQAARVNGIIQAQPGEIIGFWDIAGNLQHSMIAVTDTTWVGANNLGCFGIALGRQTINNIDTMVGDVGPPVQPGWQGNGTTWITATGGSLTVTRSAAPDRHF